MPITQADLDALQAKHGSVYYVRSEDSNTDGSPEWEYAFRKPSRLEYKRYRAMRQDPATRADAQETMLRSALLIPSGTGIDALFDAWPAVAEACNGPLMKSVGLAASEATKPSATPSEARSETQQSSQTA